MKNSKKFSNKSLNGFSRGFAYECLIPNIGEWNASRTGILCTPSIEHVDAFRVSSLPSKSQTISWKKKISSANPPSHINTLFGRVDLACIDQLASLNTAKEIQKAVQEELEWFSLPYPKPETVGEHPPPCQVKKLQTLLYCERHDKILKSCDMSPNELAALCVNRWVSTDHMCWLVRALNNLQSDTKFVYLNNELHKNPKMPYAKNIPSNFSFAINVGKDQRGNTYFGTFGRPGNHWSMCYLNISEKKAIYCDSLGWPAPADILSKLDNYVKTVNSDVCVKEYTLVFVHDPKSKNSITGAHKCNKTCAQNYPLQTCGNICGIVVLVVSAIACFNKQYFKDLTTNYPQNNRGIRPSFLRNPSRFSKYLRLAVGCWISANEVNTAYVVPQYWMERQPSIDPEKLSAPVADKPSIPVANKPSIPVADKPSIPVADKPSIPVADKPSISVANKPSIPAVPGKPSIPVGDKPSIPDANKPFIPTVPDKPSIPVVKKPSIPVANKTSVPAVPGKPSIPVGDKPSIPDANKPFIPTVPDKPSIPVVKKPSIPVANKTSVPAVPGKPSIPVDDKPSIPDANKPFIPTVPDKLSIPVVKKPSIPVANKTSVPGVPGKPSIPVGDKPSIPDANKPFIPTVPDKLSIPVVKKPSIHVANKTSIPAVPGKPSIPVADKASIPFANEASIPTVPDKPSISVADKPSSFLCSLCGMSFSRKYTLKRHTEKQHPEKSSAIADHNGHCICENCGFKCHQMKSLKDHLGKEHGIVFQTENVTFINRAGE